VTFVTDRSMEQGSRLDDGMFLQSVVLMTRAFGLDTCPQAALNLCQGIIAEHLALPENEIVVCGVSIGYADLSQPENALVSKRAALRVGWSFAPCASSFAPRAGPFCTMPEAARANAPQSTQSASGTA
jgi:nitroreductase